MSVTLRRFRSAGRLERFVSGPWPFILPGLLVYLLFNIYPIVYQFYVSLTDMTVFNISGAKLVGPVHFQFIAKDPIYLEALKFTLIFTFVTVPSQFILGFALALLLDQKLRGRLAFRLSIIVPLAMASLIVGYIWRLMLHESSAGVVNAVMNRLGLPTIRFFSNPEMARVSIYIVNIWQAVGSTMIYMLGGLQTIPTEVIEAATVDGASAWQKVVHVKLPMLRQIAGLAIIFIFVGSFQIFEKVLALTNGGPGRATHTVGFYMFQQAFGVRGGSGQGLLGRGSAMGVIMFGFILVFAILYLWLVMFERGED
jgi:fructooligosaccharide transport system permease protein